MKRMLLVIVCLLSATAFGQRQWAVNDSTFYQSANLNLIVGKNILYKLEANVPLPIANFSLPDQPDYFIRDVDVITEQQWFVLVGSRFIGNTTYLYSTNNGGSSFEPVVIQSGSETAQSINQMQVLGNRIYAFNRYYSSEVWYSDDFGIQWTKWFDSVWLSHYYQLLSCGEDLYLYGLPGDPFPSYMFKIPDSLRNQTHVTYVSGCHNTDTPGCYYSPNSTNLNLPSIDQFYRNVVHEICALGIQSDDRQKAFVSPNPVVSGGSITLHLQNDSQVVLYNLTGAIVMQKWVTTSHPVLEIPMVPAGVYLLQHQEATELLLIK